MGKDTWIVVGILWVVFLLKKMGKEKTSKPSGNGATPSPNESATWKQARAMLKKISPYNDLILKNARDYGNQDPNLIRAVIWLESEGDPKAVGDKGTSFGLMQVTWGAAHDVGFLSDWQTDTEILKTPSASIEVGCAYLYRLRVVYGFRGDNILAAYNWGPGKVGDALEAGKTFHDYPKEVQDYVNVVNMYHEALDAVT